MTEDLISSNFEANVMPAKAKKMSGATGEAKLARNLQKTPKAVNVQVNPNAKILQLKIDPNAKRGLTP